MKYPIRIEEFGGISILRDDLLEGGTKAVLMDGIVKKNPGIREFVYASPVYGGFQIALSAYCQKHRLKATIVCAKRTVKHPNTLKCLEYGAHLVEVSPGYLTVVEKRAREYCEGKPFCKKLDFGADSPENIEVLAERARKVIGKMRGGEPDEIWVAVGSGTLVRGILQAVRHARVYGVLVGADFTFRHPNLRLLRYPKPFESESRLQVPFPSTANYDRKALEMCLAHKRPAGTKVLFWNVL